MTGTDYFTLTAMAYSGQLEFHRPDSGECDRGGRHGSLREFESDGRRPTQNGRVSRSATCSRTDSGQSQISAYIDPLQTRSVVDVYRYYLKDPVQWRPDAAGMTIGWSTARRAPEYMDSRSGDRSSMTNVRWRTRRAWMIFVTSGYSDGTTTGARDHAGRFSAMESSGCRVSGEQRSNGVSWLRTIVGAARGCDFDFEVRDRRMVNPDGSCTLGSDPLGCNSRQSQRDDLQPQSSAWSVGTLGRNHGFFLSTRARAITAMNARGVVRAAGPTRMPQP